MQMVAGVLSRLQTAWMGHTVGPRSRRAGVIGMPDPTGQGCVADGARSRGKRTLRALRDVSTFEPRRLEDLEDNLL